MMFIDLGLDYFDNPHQMEVCVHILNDDGTTEKRKLSDLLAKIEPASEGARPLA